MSFTPILITAYTTIILILLLYILIYYNYFDNTCPYFTIFIHLLNYEQYRALKRPEPNEIFVIYDNNRTIKWNCGGNFHQLRRFPVDTLIEHKPTKIRFSLGVTEFGKIKQYFQNTIYISANAHTIETSKNLDIIQKYKTELNSTVYCIKNRINI